MLSNQKDISKDKSFKMLLKQENTKSVANAMATADQNTGQALRAQGGCLGTESR